MRTSPAPQKSTHSFKSRYWSGMSSEVLGHTATRDVIEGQGACQELSPSKRPITRQVTGPWWGKPIKWSDKASENPAVTEPRAGLWLISMLYLCGKVSGGWQHESMPWELVKTIPNLEYPADSYCYSVMAGDHCSSKIMIKFVCKYMYVYIYKM